MGLLPPLPHRNHSGRRMVRPQKAQPEGAQETPGRDSGAEGVARRLRQGLEAGDLRLQNQYMHMQDLQRKRSTSPRRRRRMLKNRSGKGALPVREEGRKEKVCGCIH